VSKQLIITEKPSVARDISKALGGFTDHGEYLESDDYVVTWAVGHLLRLAEPKDYRKEWGSWQLKYLPIIPDAFEYRPRDGQKKRIDQIKKLGKRKDVEGVINACDAGREGELIFREIVEYTGLDAKPMQRLWMQSMTETAIREAFDNLKSGTELEPLAGAAWLRQVGDWLIGFNATRALHQRLKSRADSRAWSAGRVQTPTLKILVDREREIIAHVPRNYWEIQATFAHEGNQWVGRWFDPDLPKSDDRDIRPSRIFDEKRAAAILAGVQKSKNAPASEKRRKSLQKPPMLFDLTTLQREANRRYGISAKRTADAAQRLYERHKVLTYPRTDSKTLPDDYGPTVLEVLDNIGGLGLTGDQAPLGGLAQRILKEGPQNLDKVLDSKGVSDHFAIVPTGTAPEEALSGDDGRVFDLVVRRFLGALMGPATWAVVDRYVDVPTEVGNARFRTSAKSLEIPGFLEALGVEEGSGSVLPPLVPGQDKVDGVDVVIEEATSEENTTRPPPRYSEAQLLRLMETAGEQIDDEDLSEIMRGRGIGTPATRANHIEELVRKAYSRRVDKKLAPTSKAIRLIDILDRAQTPALASPRLTGEWEHQLKAVEDGERPKDAMYADIVKLVEEIVGNLKGFDHSELFANMEPVGPCPECGAAVRENALGYFCEKNLGRDEGCGFAIWKEVRGKYVDRGFARDLIEKRDLEDVEGFVGFGGQSRSANVHLLKKLIPVKRKKEEFEEERWVVDVEFNRGGAGSREPEVEEGVLMPCPDHPDSEIVITNKRFVSRKLLDKEERQAPVLPRVVCQREMSDDEARAFFGETGKTEILDGFISKKGRPFRGALFRKETGKHGFEFPPREPRPGAEPKKKAAPKKKAPAKKTTAKKAPAKKTTAKKAPAKKTTAKKAPAKKTSSEAEASP
jgi:DNA topoisomerase-3